MSETLREARRLIDLARHDDRSDGGLRALQGAAPSLMPKLVELVESRDAELARLRVEVGELRQQRDEARQAVRAIRNAVDLIDDDVVAGGATAAGSPEREP